MNKRGWLYSIGIVFVVVLLGIGILWLCLPYPVSMYFSAKAETQYQPAWKISKADYEAAKNLVKSELEFFEIIERVNVSKPDEIVFNTLQSWKGPLASHGRLFTVEKQGGKWVITSRGWFLS